MKKISREDALAYHSRGRKGKVQVVPTKPTATQRDLSLAYSPGVAEPCKEIEDDYRWLDLADLLSLGVSNNWREPFGRYGFQAVFQDGTLHLDPFPLAGATAFRIPCRRIPRRAYRGDADLGGELAAARWEEIQVRVAPGLIRA